MGEGEDRATYSGPKHFSAGHFGTKPRPPPLSGAIGLTTQPESPKLTPRRPYRSLFWPYRQGYSNTCRAGLGKQGCPGSRSGRSPSTLITVPTLVWTQFACRPGSLCQSFLFRISGSPASISEQSLGLRTTLWLFFFHRSEPLK